MAADPGEPVVRAQDHRHGVPADDPADAALHRLVAREVGLLLGADRVDVARLGQRRQADLELAGALEQLVDQEPGPALAFLVDAPGRARSSQSSVSAGSMSGSWCLNSSKYMAPRRVAHLARQAKVASRGRSRRVAASTATLLQRRTGSRRRPPPGRRLRPCCRATTERPTRPRCASASPCHRPRRCGVSTQPLVLVADDEPRITKLVSIALGEEGFRVVTADERRGGAAPRPRRSGRTSSCSTSSCPTSTASRSCASCASGGRSPVILLTAKGSTADKAKGLDLGADDYIAKPFHPDELAARVRAVLRRSAGRPAGRRHPPVRRRRDRPRAADGHPRRRARPALADRVAAAPAPGRQRRQGRPPHRAADQGLGPRVPRRPPVPAGLGRRASAASSAPSRASPAGSRRSRASATCSTSTRRSRRSRPTPMSSPIAPRIRRSSDSRHGRVASRGRWREGAAGPHPRPALPHPRPALPRQAN